MAVLQPFPPMLATLLGLSYADWIVLVLYFIVILGIGWWAMWRVKSQEHYFLGGRSFGKTIQVFVSFGQATSAENAVISTTMISTNGAAGMWANLAGGLFNLPLMWFWSMWFRRVRLTTLADIYGERYNSHAMAGFYALTQGVFLIILAGSGLVAVSKTVAAIAIKPETALTVEERTEFALANEKHALEQRDYVSLPDADKARLAALRAQNPRREFSYVNENWLTVILALVVLLYAGLGGLEGAFLTDVVQGMFLLLLSVLLLPFAMMAINQLYGTSGFIGPFEAMHRTLPAEFFALWGTSAVPEFTWYWIAAYSVTALVNVAVQANGMVGPASSKDDYTARYGWIVGLFLKRYSTVLWGFLGMMTLLLYGTVAGDADYVWGLATRNLLQPWGYGLVGLMIACLLSAQMSTMSAHQMCVSALITRNLYLPLMRIIKSVPAPRYQLEVVSTGGGGTSAGPPELTSPQTNPDDHAGLSDQHLLWMGRIFGVVYIAGGVIIATQFKSVFGIIKFLVTFNAIVAASFWMGMLWRRSNRAGAWASMAVTGLMILVLPLLVPLIPGVRTSERMLKTSAEPIVTHEYVAGPADVTERQAAIARGDRGPDGQPLAPLAEGERFTKTYKNAPMPVFWAGKIETGPDGQRYGTGVVKIELLALDLLGWDLSKNSYSLNETLVFILRIIVPFGVLMIVALATKPENKELLDRFYVKMKTRVNADPEIDAREMELSYANPHRFDHIKLFGPNSNWEFRKWDWEDLKGVLMSIVAIAGCIILMVLIVNIGKPY